MNFYNNQVDLRNKKILHQRPLLAQWVHFCYDNQVTNDQITPYHLPPISMDSQIRGPIPPPGIQGYDLTADYHPKVVMPFSGQIHDIIYIDFRPYYRVLLDLILYLINFLLRMSGNSVPQNKGFIIYDLIYNYYHYCHYNNNIIIIIIINNDIHNIKQKLKTFKNVYKKIIYYHYTNT